MLTLADSKRMNNFIFLDDCLKRLGELPDKFARLIYIDPPFNTGRIQRRDLLQYDDKFDDFIPFLMDRIKASLRCLTDDGSIFVHLDWREVHYIKIEMDKLLGRDSFMNEIIWAYDFGGRSKRKWPAKHDTILWYAKDPKNYCFNYKSMDRIQYMAPGLAGPEKAAKGKTPTDVWWHTIVPTNGGEKTGYPTQKPLGVLERIVKIHSEYGDYVLDFFAGSGTTGHAAALNGRGFVLIDSNLDAVQKMMERLGEFEPEVI